MMGKVVLGRVRALPLIQGLESSSMICTLELVLESNRTVGCENTTRRTRNMRRMVHGVEESSAMSMKLDF
jgi:hypothetical protein